MIWFFQRKQARLHYEIRQQTDGPGYELVITHPDGRLEVERYAESSALLDRAHRLQSRLVEEGWQPPHMGLRSTVGSSGGY